MFFIIYFIVQKKSDIKTEIIENSYDSYGDFQMYIDKYYRDLEYFGIFPKKPKTTIIKFSKLDQLNNTTHLHGISYGYNDDDRIEIYINESSWKKFSKPMKYFLMYHELSHDLLNVDDLDKVVLNEGRLMYPALYSYGNKNMDDFIESFQALFEEEAKKRQ
jgi:glycosyltransferase involved in cell wall biosynthesis